MRARARRASKLDAAAMRAVACGTAGDRRPKFEIRRNLQRTTRRRVEVDLLGSLGGCLPPRTWRTKELRRVEKRSLSRARHAMERAETAPMLHSAAEDTAIGQATGAELGTSLSTPLLGTCSDTGHHPQPTPRTDQLAPTTRNPATTHNLVDASTSHRPYTAPISP